MVVYHNHVTYNYIKEAAKQSGGSNCGTPGEVIGVVGGGIHPKHCLSHGAMINQM